MKKLTPNLLVSNVKASAKFYEKLGFKADVLIPDEDNPVWGSMSCDGVEIMLHDKITAEEEYSLFSNKKLGATLILFIETNRIQEIYKITKDNNWTIVNDMHESSYATHEFSILDPDGYVLCFAMLKKD